MGKVFADAQEEPCVALAVLDFHFLAGDPLHPNALLLFKLLQPGGVVIAPTPAWQHLVAATYPSALAVYRREAFQAEQFDIDQLRRFCHPDLQLSFPRRVHNPRSRRGHPTSGHVCLRRFLRSGWRGEMGDRDSDPPSVSSPWVGACCRGSPDTLLLRARNRSVLGCGE